MGLIEYVIDNKIPQPITLNIRMEKIADRNNPNGNQKRYFRVFIGDEDVSTMIADFTNFHLSKAKDTYGDVIVHGCGMDMAFALSNTVWRKACKKGYENMFNKYEYHYLGYGKE